MTYSRKQELDFALALLKRMRIPANQLKPEDSLCACDGGLRKMLGMENDHEYSTSVIMRRAEERTVYKIVDQFLCRYIYFLLPNTTSRTALVLGPYLTTDFSQKDLLELAEQLHIPMAQFPHLANHYASLPVFHDPSVIFAVIYTLCESLWEGSDFDTVDVDAERRSRVPTSISMNAPIEQAHILQQMQQMEERYAYEDRLMEIVSKGLTTQAELLLSSVSQLNFQPRVPDPLRNQKNYCIICNTLLRKAAQQGGVHPFHIDKMSSQFARAIENAPTLKKCNALIGEMVAAYCHLVHSQTQQHYSPIIQKVISYIDANISGDLSLTTLAKRIQVTPNYLSSLFHRETDRTLAEHITNARMQVALSLLQTTRLQIQTVAQLCGFNDPNYFGKQFKKFYGTPPLHYRRGQASAQPSDQGMEK